jgi:hypothetical protein
MLSLNGRLLCACGCAYGIDPATGLYTVDKIYGPAVNFLSAPKPFSANRINAGLVGRNADGIIVAFRGTLAPLPFSANALRDWLEDFFEQPESVRSGAMSVPGAVHCGFYTAVTSIIGTMAEYVKTLDPTLATPVYVTGNSKGGAMASIGAYLLRQSFGIPVRAAVTFASPRTGDSNFKAGYEAVINHTRFENYGDIVPLVPPSHAPIDLLVSILKRIPNVGSEIAGWFKAAQEWDYRPVGTPQFIDSSAARYQIRTDETLASQVLAVLEQIGRDLLALRFTSVIDAHTLSCGYGYMHGTCPTGVCDSV